MNYYEATKQITEARDFLAKELERPDLYVAMDADFALCVVADYHTYIRWHPRDGIEPLTLAARKLAKSPW